MTVQRTLKSSGLCLPALVGALVMLFLAGCAVNPPAAPVAAADLPPSAVESSYLDSAQQYVRVTETDILPEPTPEPSEADPDNPVFVTVTTQGSRANLRSGPGLDFEIVAKGNPGTTFEVLSRSQDGTWWEVCCVQGEDDKAGETTLSAWVAAAVVTTDGAAAAVPVAATDDPPLIPSDLTATWDVDWQCGSDRCTVQACKATVTATATTSTDPQWLPIDHVVSWNDECFPPDQWVFEIDRRTAAERTGDFAENFLYGYWLGQEPGDFNGVYKLDANSTVAVWCSDSQSVEINEGDGWTSVYEGRTCHDLGTGMLVLLNYTKRWLYTGEYDGNTYDRAYFGDSETLEQRLVDTNVELAPAKRK